MLWILALILVVLWSLGMVTTYAAGGFVHISPRSSHCIRRSGGSKGTVMKTQIFRMSLIAIFSFSAAAFVGCDRDDATKAGNSVENAADKAGDAVDKGMDKAGAAANTSINAANDAGRQAVDTTKDATDTARGAVGRAAQTSGEAVDQAGHAVKDWVSPTTAPTTAPDSGK